MLVRGRGVDDMDRDRMIELGREAGFAAVEVISTEDLVFNHSFRMFCEQNACGNYGKNYGCPPYCGTPEEMEERVRRYEKAVVFQSDTPVEDIYDDNETKVIKKKHTKMTLEVMEKYGEEGIAGEAVMAGPCNFCEECKMEGGEPCINEKMRFSCLSAYCIDAGQMASTCGMDMVWGGDTVSFFSLFLFQRR